MADYNQSLDEAEAIKRFRILEEENLLWIEEPLNARDFKGHARIRSQVKTPIQCGENWWGLPDISQAVNDNATDYLMFNAMRIGGVTGWMKAAVLAESQNIRLSSHLWPEISAQLLSLSATSHWLEYTDWWNPILANPLTIRNGCTSLTGVIGTGIEWNEKEVDKFCV